jgi:hypothetical protein
MATDPFFLAGVLYSESLSIAGDLCTDLFLTRRDSRILSACFDCPRATAVAILFVDLFEASRESSLIEGDGGSPQYGRHHGITLAGLCAFAREAEDGYSHCHLTCWRP